MVPIQTKIELDPSDYLDTQRLLRRVIGTQMGQNETNFHVMNMVLGIEMTIRSIEKMDDGNDLQSHHFTDVIRSNIPLLGPKMPEFLFKDYSPVAFMRIREKFGVDNELYINSICDFNYLFENVSSGKSGCKFYFSADGSYCIKTITHDELNVIREFLFEYYQHICSFPNTLLCRFYGLHRTENKDNGKRTYFVVMGNVFDTPLYIHEQYDIKGSTHGRKIPNDKVDLETSTLKDLNYLELRGPNSILLGPKQHVFLDQLKIDANFLASIDVMDYSLLIGIHKKNQSIPLKYEKHINELIDAWNSGPPLPKLTPAVIAGGIMTPAIQGPKGHLVSLFQMENGGFSSVSDDVLGSFNGIDAINAPLSPLRGNKNTAFVGDDEVELFDFDYDTTFVTCETLSPVTSPVSTNCVLTPSIESASLENSKDSDDLVFEQLTENEKKRNKTESKNEEIELSALVCGVERCEKYYAGKNTGQHSNLNTSEKQISETTSSFVTSTSIDGRRVSQVFPKHIIIDDRLKFVPRTTMSMEYPLLRIDSKDDVGSYLTNGERLPSISSHNPLYKLRESINAQQTIASTKADVPFDAGDEVYYFGIIDITTVWGTKKSIEHFFRSVYTDGDTISAVNPRHYAERFISFVDSLLGPVPILSPPNPRALNLSNLMQRYIFNRCKTRYICLTYSSTIHRKINPDADISYCFVCGVKVFYNDYRKICKTKGRNSWCISSLVLNDENCHVENKAIVCRSCSHLLKTSSYLEVCAKLKIDARCMATRFDGAFCNKKAMKQSFYCAEHVSDCNSSI
eukprot:TRINITY_DN2726_c0_g2_i1.p1 TRINITY_DN2726_c0_g2~~TRINITY_DN2726_c0_g2_i1.p1  ORF type:complete len:796 (+),score=151.48 TRINITY_DN2726_c0_g2_i1:73-2460(+)